MTTHVTETPEEWGTVRQQQEYYHPQTVPVCIDDPIATWSLPAKRSSMYTVTYDQLSFLNPPLELIPADPRIKNAWIMASGTNCIVGSLEQVMNANRPLGFTMPANTPMKWEGFEQALFAVANSAGSGTVSVRIEYWAD